MVTKFHSLQLQMADLALDHLAWAGLRVLALVYSLVQQPTFAALYFSELAIIYFVIV